MSEDAEALLLTLEWSGRDRDGHPTCPVCAHPPANGHAMQCRMKDALGQEPRVWRHRKRGTTYREVGVALLQTTGGALRDQDKVMVYRAEEDGALYVRALIEFTDGRFGPAE